MINNKFRDSKIRYDLYPENPSEIVVWETKNFTYRDRAQDLKCPKGFYIQDIKVKNNVDLSIRAI